MDFILILSISCSTTGCDTLRRRLPFFFLHKKDFEMLYLKLHVKGYLMNKVLKEEWNI